MRYLIVGIVAFALAGLPGCTMAQIGLVQEQLENIETRMARIEPGIAEAQARLDDVAAQVAAMPPGEERDAAGAIEAEMSARIEEMRAWLIATQATSTRLREALADSETAADVVEGIGGAAEKSLPPPWGALAGAGAGLVALAIRELQNRRRATNLVHSVQPAVDAASTEVKARIRAKQSVATQAFVDRVQACRPTPGGSGARGESGDERGNS